MDSISLLTNTVLPTTSGVPALPLQPGQVVQALVLELLQSGAFRLELPEATLDIRTGVTLTPGETVALAVKGNGPGAKLVILGEEGSAPRQQGHASSTAAVGGRAVIGEATVVARVTTSGGGALAAPTAHPAAPAAPVQQDPATPAQALAESVRAAVVRQGGLAPLFADVEQLVARSGATLPKPVLAAATQLLGLRVALAPELGGADIKQALQRSGVLLEPRLASLPQAQSTQPAQAPHELPAADDLKAALLVLRAALKGWAATTGDAPARAVAAGDLAMLARLPAIAKGLSGGLMAALGDLTPEPSGQAPMPQQTSLSVDDAVHVAKALAVALSGRAPGPVAADTAPPPLRGAPLTAQAPAAATLADGMSPRETAERLLAQTDAALSRQTLLQAASLPDGSDAATSRVDQQNARWIFEVPFATPQGTAIAQFEVSRDGQAARQDGKAATWRARFTVDVEPMGPVHALVALAGERASVTLWAERPMTAAQLGGNASMLGEALRAAELEPSELMVRVGAPRIQKPATPGQFMDRAS